jgi:hypothetical protein
MKNSERNLMVIENFILHLTHCCGGEPEFKESVLYSPEEMYQMAKDYIKEDHVDGEGNIEDGEVYPEEQVRLMLASFAPYVRYETKGMNGITWSMIANDWFNKNK